MALFVVGNLNIYYLFGCRDVCLIMTYIILWLKISLIIRYLPSEPILFIGLGRAHVRAV